MTWSFKKRLEFFKPTRSPHNDDANLNKMIFNKLQVHTKGQNEFINITSQISQKLDESNIEAGICSIFIPHTTAGITINEAADPSVVRDILMELEKIVPYDDGYTHGEGNSAAHIKAALTGSSVTIPVVGGRMELGTWQGIFFCEFDGPRTRSVYCSIIET